MPVTHTNRKGTTYYLHQGTTKKGNPNYFFATRDEGDLVEAIPPGYEIYENPNAQVFLRRKRPEIITAGEIATIEAGMRQYCHLQHFIVDAKKNAVVIYTPDQDVDDLVELFGYLSHARKEEAKARVNRYLSFSPMLQFVLTDEQKRLFQTQRFCFLGSIDDWIPIGKVDTLPRLVKTYARHLGEDSFYDLYD